MKTKKILLFTCFIYLFTLKAQQNEGISMGSSYINDIYYSLQNGIISTVERTNWELAFATNSYDSNIRINSGAGVTLHEVSDDINEWDNITEQGLNAIELMNSNTSWEEGAFVQNSSGGLNYGWGNYNTETHIIEACKVYIINYNNLSKKIKIDNLNFGTYNFTIANLDGTDEELISVPAAEYQDKNFVYYSLSNGEILDREPNSDEWDLLFTKYIEDLYNNPSDPMYYNVMGVLTNHNLVAEYNGDLEAEPSILDLDTTRYTNTIGYDWKEFSGTYQIVQNRAYYILDQDEEISYRIIFQAFSGGSNGDIAFTIEEMEEIELNIIKQESVDFLSYPNPSNGQFTVQLPEGITNNCNLSISDLAGKILHEQSISGKTQIHVNFIPQGIYLLTIKSDSGIKTQKIIIQ